MDKIQAREGQILEGYRKIFTAPEVVAKRYKTGGYVLLLLAMAVAAVSGHLVREKAQYDAGQLLAILSGILLGLSVMLFVNSNQMLTFAKFCMLKNEYRNPPNQPPEPVLHARDASP